MSLLSGFLSLSKSLNKTKGEFTDETEEGIVSEPLAELKLNKEDDELIELSRKWRQRWESSEKKKELERKQSENEKYWLGDHLSPSQKQTGKKEPLDNLIFESLETSLPTYTRQIATPVIGTDKTPEGILIGKKVENRLIDIADVIKLRKKVKKAVRHWALYYLGCIKLGWSLKNNEIAVKVIRPQLLILDPDAITDECEYEGEYIGEYRTDTASDLIKRFPNKKADITLQVNDNLGTRIRYIEWQTSEYIFWELKGEILGKAKNPNWNYEQEVKRVVVDEYGEEKEVTEKMPAINHFSSAKVPFAFLSVFNLGKGPVDDTNLIEQSLPIQDIINKRVRQIDRNADQMNAGAVVSGDAFTRDEAAQVANALRKGQTVWVPRGNVNSVYKRDAGTAIPEFVYQSLVDARNELRNVFGSTGLTSSGIKSEETVRGKIMVRGIDTDRAGLIVDDIEQFYDYIFNWMVQLMCVHYDSPHKVSRTQGTEEIINTELFEHPVTITIKDGSLIPKDRLTQRNEAVDLWGAGAIDPLTFFERLEDPNPLESTKRLMLWKANPMEYARLYGGINTTGVSPPTGEATGAVNEEQPQVEPNLLSNVPIS